MKYLPTPTQFIMGGLVLVAWQWIFSLTTLDDYVLPKK